jgi:hypothetical protein
LRSAAQEVYDDAGLAAKRRKFTTTLGEQRSAGNTTTLSEQRSAENTTTLGEQRSAGNLSFF